MCDREKKEAMYGCGQQQEGLTKVGVLGEGMLRLYNKSAIQYTPLLVIMMLEMYSIPDRRSYYLYGTLPPAQNEVMELLRRAKIVVPAPTPPVFGAAPMWEVDEEALRAYANAVCNVSLPERFWRV